VQDSRFNNSLKFTVAYKLTRADGFDHVIHEDNIADTYFKIFFTRNFKNNARLGIISSKKSLPNSADRNRVKRFIREAFRRHNVKHCKLDIVVKVSRAYSRRVKLPVDNLKKLFSHLEARCAKS
jgi:ribonuclease P protein component